MQLSFFLRDIARSHNVHPFHAWQAWVALGRRQDLVQSLCVESTATGTSVEKHITINSALAVAGVDI